MSPIHYWMAAMLMHGSHPMKVLNRLQQSSIEMLYQTAAQDLKTQIAAELQWMDNKTQHIISYDDPDYPSRLKELADPPLLLYVRGNKAALQLPQIAMVGARHASSFGVENAAEFAAGLTKAGLVVTSGLARGIDAASHRGALKGDGMTVAVCGTGLNYIYPPAHKLLVEKILAQNGALISEFKLTERAYPGNFPRRNRIIAGLSLGVLVVEAAVKSGSLITARLAAENGRDVYAIPGNIRHPLSHGCHHLIRQGAKLVETVEDITDEYKHLSLSSVSRTVEQTSLAQVAPECEQLLKFIDYAVTPVDMIVSRSGMATSQLAPLLLSLELDGYINSVTGGYTRTQ